MATTQALEAVNLVRLQLITVKSVVMTERCAKSVQMGTSLQAVLALLVRAS